MSLRKASSRCLRACYGHLSSQSSSRHHHHKHEQVSSPTEQVSDLRMRVFCRCTAQRLRDVRRRVEAAKLDVEDIIRNAKVLADIF